MNWTSAYLRPRVVASAWASVDLPRRKCLDQQVAAREEAGQGESQRVTLPDHHRSMRQHAGGAIAIGTLVWLSGAYGHGSFSVALVP